MKIITYVIIGTLLTAGIAFSAFTPLSEDAYQQIANNPGLFPKYVKGANSTELAQATANTLKSIVNSEFEDTIQQRMVAVVSAAIAEAGKDAPQVAVAAMEAVSDEYKPTVSAAAFIVSGKHAPQVKKALLGAAYGTNREKISQALDNPVSLALGNDLARVATHYAVSALVPKPGGVSISAGLDIQPQRRVTRLVNPQSVDLATGSTAGSTTTSTGVNCPTCCLNTASFFKSAGFYNAQTAFYRKQQEIIEANN